MSQKILIVGAGPGGIATAMRLAAAGYEVSIYGAADRVGGRMRGLTLGDYHFDTGPTILPRRTRRSTSATRPSSTRATPPRATARSLCSCRCRTCASRSAGL
ncbi:MAG: NAD(P)-binding protein [Chloroflexales bacterium]|nr:NAD(P)-binding protein [Chloroflexales bacterium]